MVEPESERYYRVLGLRVEKYMNAGGVRMPRGSTDPPNTGGHLCLVQSFVGKMKEDGLEKPFRCLNVRIKRLARSRLVSLLRWT